MVTKLIIGSSKSGFGSDYITFYFCFLEQLSPSLVFNQIAFVFPELAIGFMRISNFVTSSSKAKFRSAGELNIFCRYFDTFFFSSQPILISKCKGVKQGNAWVLNDSLARFEERGLQLFGRLNLLGLEEIKRKKKA